MNINLQIIKIPQVHGTVLYKSLDFLKPQYNSKNLNFCKGIDLCITFNKAMRFQIAINMQQICTVTLHACLCDMRL